MSKTEHHCDKKTSCCSRFTKIQHRPLRIFFAFLEELLFFFFTSSGSSHLPKSKTIILLSTLKAHDFYNCREPLSNFLKQPCHQKIISSSPPKKPSSRCPTLVLLHAPVKKKSSSLSSQSSSRLGPVTVVLFCKLQRQVDE